MKFYRLIFLSTFAFLIFLQINTKAQLPVKMDDKVPHHIFNYGEIELLEDTAGTLSFQDILKPDLDKQFSKSQILSQ
ncbi:hypothetical protein QG516_02020 [Pedobacter gandavensis]|uniref:hypothetical protein n=1 Tax=Pedobacter TaxID=84567 RepID=UPI001C996701|nr:MULTISPECIES: hypothetical protein [Pedobacter]WGQ10430.1 hypothetical protein QG516_02020 [Pedobacter gandavensis]